MQSSLFLYHMSVAFVVYLHFPYKHQINWCKLIAIAENDLGIGKGDPYAVFSGILTPQGDMHMPHREHRNGFEFEAQSDSASAGGFPEILELLVDHGFEGMARAMQVSRSV